VDSTPVRFRQSLRSYTWVTVHPVLIAVAGVIYESWRESQRRGGIWHVPLLDIGVVLVGGGLVAFGALVAITRLCSISVDENGIRAFDFIGRYHSCPWGSLSAAAPATVFGLAYLKVTSTASPRALWIPLFLEDNAGFLRLAERFGGPTNPLVQGLRERGRLTSG